MKGKIDYAMALFFGQSNEICEENQPVRQTTATQRDDK